MAILQTGLGSNPSTASFTLHDSGAGWYIEMNFARSAIDAEMSRLYGEEELQNLGKEEYQELFLDYAKDNISISGDGLPVDLGEGSITLGGHQSDLKFDLPGLDDPGELNVEVRLFEEVSNQTNIFRIYRGGDKIFRVSLNADNDFGAYMNFEGGQVLLAESPVVSFWKSYFLVGVILLLLLVATNILALRYHEEVVPSGLE